jgi:hypothetical protein
MMVAVYATSIGPKIDMPGVLPIINKSNEADI